MLAGREYMKRAAATCAGTRQIAVGGAHQLRARKPVALSHSSPCPLVLLSACPVPLRLCYVFPAVFPAVSPVRLRHAVSATLRETNDSLWRSYLRCTSSAKPS